MIFTCAYLLILMFGLSVAGHQIVQVIVQIWRDPREWKFYREGAILWIIMYVGLGLAILALFVIAIIKLIHTL